MECNIGLLETVGEHIGDKVDFSELECTTITLVLKTIVLGVQLKLKLLGSTSMKNLKLLTCELENNDRCLNLKLLLIFKSRIKKNSIDLFTYLAYLTKKKTMIQIY